MHYVQFLRSLTSLPLPPRIGVQRKAWPACPTSTCTVYAVEGCRAAAGSTSPVTASPVRHKPKPNHRTRGRVAERCTHSAIIINTTRMHSSRMRTGRSLTVCCSLLPGGGCLVRGGVCSRGCAWSGGVCSGGGSAPRGWVGIPACTEADTPPPPCGQAHACENITLAQLRCGR